MPQSKTKARVQEGDGARKDAVQPPKKDAVSFRNLRESREEKAASSKRGTVPLSVYRIKDAVRTLFSNKNFTDALATTFAVLSVAAAFPSVPLPVLIAMLVITFIITLVHPFAGLIFLLFETLPMIIYQVPLIAWIFTLFISAALIVGFKHYRTITFTYMLIVLPLSHVGYFLLIPAFVLTVISVGFKRSVAASLVALLVVFMMSGITGIPTGGGVVYNNTGAFSYATTVLGTANIVPSRQAASLGSIGADFGSALGRFWSFGVISQIFSGLEVMPYSLTVDTGLIAMQLAVWIIAVLAVSSYAVRSRSRFKGTEASIFGLIIIIPYVALSAYAGLQISAGPFIGFAGIVLFLFLLELNDVEVVRALDVMKQDFRGRFGEAFEDLSSGTHETFEDIANYEETKKELREAVLAPIENRSLAGAYNIKAPKGILMFGPPGTGKTLIMRALANELHVGFFYVKTANILSPYAGESSSQIAKIFDVAKKHAPCILFFDEIDSVAGNRTEEGSGNERQILSALLTEMDGFQRIDNVVIIGATNVPQLLDPAIMRPGRFDKIIYMPLPTAAGRSLIFRYHLSKLPVSRKIDYSRLASVTERYSGADIKGICDEVARRTADQAGKENTVLSIETDDVLSVIKMTKASTTLASLEMYTKFKSMYERRGFVEAGEEAGEEITLDDVAGLSEVKKALYNAVELPIIHPELVKKYDIKVIHGVLMFGPPGNGKTMLMRAVANDIGSVKFISADGVEIMREGPENAISEIKKVFDRAKENAPSILFIDEIDTLVPSRENASEGGTMVAGEFLQQMDGIGKSYNIVLVAATNRPDALDPAMLRPGRFDRLVYIPPPNAGDRETIFRQNLAKAPLDKGVDPKSLAVETDGYTGADIASICGQAKMLALERSASGSSEDMITMEDIMGVIKKVKPSAPGRNLKRYADFVEKYGER